MAKPKLSFWQIWNMSFGFLGIQFGFALQGGFMSRIFQTMGASIDSIPNYWIAAPLTGLLVQPIIGYLSDRTWHKTLGRRRPYFLVGAIFGSITLIFVPYSPALWVAVGCLWILDASINISMEPFRALVADKLPDSQLSRGFVMQALIIGIGTWVASNLPWMFNQLGVSNESVGHTLPLNVKYAFAIGGLIFLSSILYTIFTTKEYPPEDMEKFERERRESAGLWNGIVEITKNIVHMPSTMAKLGVVQFFSWFAFFTMWSMATPALTEHVFNSPKPELEAYDMSTTQSAELYTLADASYNNAADLVGSAMGTYGLSSMVFALLLIFVTRRRRINRKYVHMTSLLIGGIGFITMFYSHDQNMLHLCFACIGISWASILSMPYAMLSTSINPAKMGVFMGLFNMFIVIPQIIAAIGVSFLYKNLLGEATINAMILAGAFLIVAAISTTLITEKRAISYSPETED